MRFKKIETPDDRKAVDYLILGANPGYIDLALTILGFEKTSTDSTFIVLENFILFVRNLVDTSIFANDSKEGEERVIKKLTLDISDIKEKALVDEIRETYRNHLAFTVVEFEPDYQITKNFFIRDIVSEPRDFVGDVWYPNFVYLNAEARERGAPADFPAPAKPDDPCGGYPLSCCSYNCSIF